MRLRTGGAAPQSPMQGNCWICGRKIGRMPAFLVLDSRAGFLLELQNVQKQDFGMPTGSGEPGFGIGYLRGLGDAYGGWAVGRKRHLHPNHHHLESVTARHCGTGTKPQAAISID